MAIILSAMKATAQEQVHLPSFYALGGKTNFDEFRDKTLMSINRAPWKHGSSEMIMFVTTNIIVPLKDMNVN